MEATSSLTQRAPHPAAGTLPAKLIGLHVHMLGAGGSGMAGLSAALLKLGARVSGSDRVASPAVARLRALGALLTTGEPATLPADVDLIVASAAIPADHPVLTQAQRRGARVVKYSEMLGLLMQRGVGVAISGTHGKSTTTAWLTYALSEAGLDPSFVVGADVPQLGGGSGVGAGRYFVAEACEYDRSFLNLRPRMAAILNVEEDHLDYYQNLDDICAAFQEFAALLPPDGLLLLNGDDDVARRAAGASRAPVETFGLTPGCDWRGIDLTLEEGAYAFEIHRREQALGRVRLGLSGLHNVQNGLAVAALATHAGVPWPVLAAALARFEGAGRRLELRGHERGVRVADDYAHHPTEIRATLAAARERFSPSRLWCVFQPHQHSRTRFLLEDFARSFRLADEIVVPDIYFVRDSQRDQEAVSAMDLVERLRAEGRSATHLSGFGQIVELLSRETRPGDLVLTMGAGDVWKIADELVRALRTNLPA